MLDPNCLVSPMVARATIDAHQIPESLQVDFWLVVVPAQMKDHDAFIKGEAVNTFIEQNKN